MFGKSKPKLDRRTQLLTKPMQLVSARINRRDDGGANLIVPLKQRPIAGWLFRMPDGAAKTFELDQMGMLIWDNIDGKTTVQQLIRKLAKRYQVSLREAEVSTLTFLNMLTRKGLVGMQVADKSKSAPNKSDT